MKNLTVGSDPEFFLLQSGRTESTKDPVMGLVKKKLPPVVVTAIGRVGGTKKNPLRISSNTCVQEDGVALEINPAVVQHEYGSNAAYDSVVLSLSEAISHINAKDQNLEIFFAPEHRFTKTDLDSHVANIIGCDPDKNAFEHGAVNPTFSPVQLDRWRFCGGHLHFGCETEIPPYAMVQMLDAFVLFPNWAADMRFIGYERARFYGKAGAYRDKPYGFEWRTPSNHWYGRADFVRQACDFVLWCINNEADARHLYDMMIPNLIRDLMDSREPSSMQVEQQVNRILDLKDGIVKINYQPVPAPFNRNVRTTRTLGATRIRLDVGTTQPFPPQDLVANFLMQRGTNT